MSLGQLVLLLYLYLSSKGDGDAWNRLLKPNSKMTKSLRMSLRRDGRSSQERGWKQKTALGNTKAVVLIRQELATELETSSFSKAWCK